MSTNRLDVSQLPEAVRIWISEKVASGQYSSPEGVLEAAIRALEVAELREQVHVAARQIDSGDCYTYDDAGLEELKREIREEGEGVSTDFADGRRFLV